MWSVFFIHSMLPYQYSRKFHTAPRGSAPFENCDNTLTLAEEAGIGSSDIAKIEVAGTPVEKVRLAFRDQR